MPGLLDLLTVRALAHPSDDEAAPDGPDGPDRPDAPEKAGTGGRRPGAPRTASGNHRLWVEVEA
jgi:hypothetical protein